MVADGEDGGFKEGARRAGEDGAGTVSLVEEGDEVGAVVFDGGADGGCGGGGVLWGVFGCGWVEGSGNAAPAGGFGGGFGDGDWGGAAGAGDGLHWVIFLKIAAGRHHVR